MSLGDGEPSALEAEECVRVAGLLLQAARLYTEKEMYDKSDLYVSVALDFLRAADL